MPIGTVRDAYEVGLIGASEFIPRQLIDFVLRSLKSSKKIELFSKSAIAAQKAYDEIADRTPYHESYTPNDLRQLTAARREAYLYTFTTLLLNQKNYC